MIPVFNDKIKYEKEGGERVPPESSQMTYSEVVRLGLKDKTHFRNTRDSSVTVHSHELIN